MLRGSIYGATLAAAHKGLLCGERLIACASVPPITTLRRCRDLCRMFAKDVVIATNLTVMSTLAVEVALKRHLLPAWSARNADAPTMVWKPTAVLTELIGRGERADVLLMIDGAMDELVRTGIVEANSVRPIARAGFGIAVRTGTPHPDISTPESLRDALSRARAVAISRTGASGRHFKHVIETLGIAAEVQARAVVIPEGFTAEKLSSGEADLAVQQISELMAVDGVEVVGPFPPPLQVETDFSAGLFTESRRRASAEAFLAFLGSDEAAAAYRLGGLVPRFLQPAGGVP